MKTMRVDNEATLAKNESAIDRLRADMERTANSNTTKIMVGMGIGVAFLSVVIVFVGLFLRIQ
ncbi:MAG: hypothetical protein OXF09_01810 [Hyphomicrobiales bacterium]|nr:hypothetical protein [Hyphomicrobiales bacterium]MCY4038175.1 hypothetical protein [Hyphomicrobiales bacterium]